MLTLSGAGAVAALSIAHAALATAFTLGAIVAIAREARARVAAREPVLIDEVILLRPIEHIEPSWAERVAREAEAIAQVRPVVSVVVCAPPGQPDSAVAILVRAGVRVVDSVVANDEPCNRKVRHLAAGVAATRAGFRSEDAAWVQVDADVIVDRRDIHELLATLERGNADDLAFAVPAPFAIGAVTPSFAILRAILTLSPQAFAAVHALARLTGGPPAVAGQLVAMRARALERIGGYPSIATAVADDVALVERIAAVGGAAHRAARAVRVDADSMTLRAVRARMTRWLRVIRAARPRLLATYPLFVAPLPIALSLALAAALAGGRWWTWTPVLALFAARVALAGALSRGPYRERTAMGGPWGLLWLVLADATLLGAALSALGDRRIVWADRLYQLDDRGHITAVTAMRL